MALTDDGGMNTTMLVGPTGVMPYGNNGGFGNSFGGDWGWIILILLLAGGGWGMGGFGGGFGGFGGAYEFPWLLTGQQNINSNTNNGFRDAMINDGINSVRDGIGNLSTQLCGCCGDIQNSLCNGFAGVNATVNSGFANAETAANARQMANMQQAFAGQTAMAQGFNQLGTQFADCCCENRLASADLKYTIATENCADRQALNEGVRDILASQTAGIQRILDKLCDQELQAERRDNQNLRSELMYARGQASQVAQTAELRQSGATQLNQLVSELRSCPIPAQPVYGSQPIFTCSGNNGCGCGCNQF